MTFCKIKAGVRRSVLALLTCCACSLFFTFDHVSATEPDVEVAADPNNMIWSTFRDGACSAVAFHGALGIDRQYRPSYFELGNSLQVIDVTMKCGQNGLANGDVNIKIVIKVVYDDYDGSSMLFTRSYSGNFVNGLLQGDWNVDSSAGSDRLSYKMTHRNGCWTPVWAGTGWGDVDCDPLDGVRMRDQLLAQSGQSPTKSATTDSGEAYALGEKVLGSPPVVVNGLQRGFNPPFYPEPSDRKKEQGQVEFKVLIDQYGNPRRCEILVSSGYDDLDDGTCWLARTKVMYDPALDTAGKPIPAWLKIKVIWIHGKEGKEVEGDVIGAEPFVGVITI